MTIGKRTVARKLTSYLRHRTTLAELVGWCVRAMMDAEFSQSDLPVVRDVVSRLGVADVRAFGLPWEDCEDMLRRLGHAVHLDIVAR